LALGSVALLKAELERAGIVSKRREGAGGELSGGKRFSRGALYLMLQNWLYRGNVVHKEKIYPGQHEAIIEPELWQAVQDRLAAGRRERSMAVGAEAPSLLSQFAADRPLRNHCRYIARKGTSKLIELIVCPETTFIRGSLESHKWRMTNRYGRGVCACLARLPTEYKFTVMFWHNGENDTFNRYERHTTQVRERVWKTSRPDPRAAEIPRRQDTTLHRPSLTLVGPEKVARFFDSSIFQVPMQPLPSGAVYNRQPHCGKR
jgi:hypothetical protein